MLIRLHAIQLCHDCTALADMFPSVKLNLQGERAAQPCVIQIVDVAVCHNIVGVNQQLAMFQNWSKVFEGQMDWPQLWLIDVF